MINPVLHLVPNPRARRYILRVKHDGTVRVTIPRGGSEGEAHRFAAEQNRWISQQLLNWQHSPKPPREWTEGTEVWIHGRLERLEISPGESIIRAGRYQIPFRPGPANLRPSVEQFLRRQCDCLVARAFELASRHKVPLRQVTIRNQRRRWGSCSTKGTVSLNWRLLQTPDYVRDYIILHELMHLREMNHSRRFWAHVRAVCPEFETAEQWLKTANLLH